jgi:hypothetical protein
MALQRLLTVLFHIQKGKYGIFSKMKFFLIFLFPAAAICQVPKKANTIIIHGVSQEQAIIVFKAAGYLIAGSGNGFISTVPQKSKNGIEIVLQMEIKDSTGYLQGIYDGRQIREGLWKFNESYAGHYRGGSFEMMDSVAHMFRRPISYTER